MRILFYLSVLTLHIAAMQQQPVSNVSNATKKTPAGILLEKAREESFVPFPENVVKPSHREEHSVADLNIEHYSMYRAYSVSTYINDNTPNPRAGYNYYIARTLSHFPHEGINETYGGTQESPINKRARIKTGANTFELKEELITQIEALSPENAKILFKYYRDRHKLFDKPPEEWLQEIKEKNQPQIPNIATKSDNKP